MQLVHLAVRESRSPGTLRVEIPTSVDPQGVVEARRAIQGMLPGQRIIQETYVSSGGGALTIMDCSEEVIGQYITRLPDGRTVIDLTQLEL